MTSLSWLIYIAQVSGTLSNATGALAFLSVVAMIIGGGIGMLGAFGEKDYIAFYAKACKALIPIALVMGLFSALIPTKQTMMMVAAAEMGHTVISSKSVQDLVDPSVEFAQKWLKNQIEEISTAKKK